MAKKNIKQISFSDQMISLADRRASELGIDLPEYIRYLVLDDTKRYLDKDEYISDKQAQRILDTIQKVEEGDYIYLKNEKELKKYFKTLLNDEL